MANFSLPNIILTLSEVPRFVVLKSASQNVYLNVKANINKDVGILPAELIKCDAEDVMNPFAKFELEMGKSPEVREKGWVHIRSCYNNKYWVKAEDSDWIVAKANKPEEDKSKPSCTLFQIEKIITGYYEIPPGIKDRTLDENSYVSFHHVNSWKFTTLWWDDSISPYYGGVRLTEWSAMDFNIVNWNNLVVLPKRIAFKDKNGKYLCARMIEGYPYHEFAETARDESAEYELTTTKNGCVRIKSLHHGAFWRRSPNWIWADSSDESSNDKDTLFWPIKVSDNVVALRNMGNNWFCKSLTTEGKTNCLNAGTPSIETSAQLVVEELVVSRDIYHINFHLQNARVYNESLIALAKGGVANYSYGTEPKTYTLKLNYKDVKSSFWSHNVSLKLEAKSEIIVKIPIPGIDIHGQLNLQANFDWTHRWGESHISKSMFETSYSVTVPPRTKTTVTLVATMALCDVPFSYTQTEILTNGLSVTKPMHDGVFVGGNYYNFEFMEELEKL